MKREPWADYFTQITNMVSRRSTCNRAKVGCILVQDKRIISTGYNGAPPGEPHCDDEGHIMVEGHCIRAIHAEINAIGQAAKLGISTDGAVAYVTHTPCISCQQALIAAGIRFVIARHKYGNLEIVQPLEVSYYG